MAEIFAHQQGFVSAVCGRGITGVMYGEAGEFYGLSLDDGGTIIIVGAVKWQGDDPGIMGQFDTNHVRR